jgi:protein involved in polysaccharide export with SLBB domain
VPFLGLALAAGCAVHKPHVDEAMRSDSIAEGASGGTPQQYIIESPDVLEVSIPGKTAGAVRCAVNLDGRLDLAPVNFCRVEGQTLPQIRETLSTVTGGPASGVQVRVAEYRSQHLYVWGPGVGPQRAVPYEGPETVLEFLKRVGGIKAGAAPSDVHVIRPGVVENRPPEVFHVDLKAVVLKQDPRTNIRLQPFDQVYVGETRASFVEHCLPRWVRPIYDKVCGLHPAGERPDGGQNGARPDQIAD